MNDTTVPLVVHEANMSLNVFFGFELYSYSIKRYLDEICMRSRKKF